MKEAVVYLIVSMWNGNHVRNDEILFKIEEVTSMEVCMLMAKEISSFYGPRLDSTNNRFLRYIAIETRCVDETQAKGFVK